jgi:hypothetical protein
MLLRGKKIKASFLSCQTTCQVWHDRKVFFFFKKKKKKPAACRGSRGGELKEKKIKTSFLLIISSINSKLHWLMILNKRTKKNSSYFLELSYVWIVFVFYESYQNKIFFLV